MMTEQDHKLVKRLMRLQWLLHRHQMESRRAHGPMGDPHRGQGRVLAILKLQPEISQKELAYLLDIRPQSLGELLTKLERNGYIERMPAAADRRLLLVKLTEQGRAAAAQDAAEEREDALFQCLTAEERETLADYLDRLTVSWEERFGLAAEDGPEEGCSHHRPGRFGPHGPRRGGPGPFAPREFGGFHGSCALWEQDGEGCRFRQEAERRADPECGTEE